MTDAEAREKARNTMREQAHKVALDWFDTNELEQRVYEALLSADRAAREECAQMLLDAANLPLHGYKEPDGQYGNTALALIERAAAIRASSRHD